MRGRRTQLVVVSGCTAEAHPVSAIALSGR